MTEYNRGEHQEAKSTMRILLLRNGKNDPTAFRNWLIEAPENFVLEQVMKLDDFVVSLSDFSPEIIFSELDFKEFSNEEVLAFSINTLPSVPFVILCTASQEEKALHLVEAGAFDYLLQNSLNRLPVVIRNAQNHTTNSMKDVQKNANRLEYALESIETGAWELDLVNFGAWRSLRHDQIFGYEKNLPQWTYEIFLNHVIPEDRDGVDRKFKAALADKTEWSFECRIKTVTGLDRWIRAKGSQELNQQNEAVKMFGIVQDITIQKEAQIKLEERERRFRQLFENMTQGVYYQLADGTFYDINYAALQMFGVSRKEFLGIRSQDPLWHVVDEYGELIPPEDYPSLRALRTGKSVNDFNIGVHRLKSDSYVWLNVNAIPEFMEGESKPYQVFVTMHDMTQIKRAELESSRLTSLIDQSSDDIMITDTLGNIQYVNPAFEKISGYTIAELKGKPASLFKSGKHNDDFYKDLWETLLEGNVWNGIIINRAKDGSLFEEESIIFPIYDRNKNTINYGSIRRDTAEKRKMEEQLRQSQKMKAIGTLAGGIAHDFNNILNGIHGYTELTLRSLDKRSCEFDNLQQVLKASTRASELVKQILRFSRQEEQKIQSMPVQKVLREALNLLRSSIPSTIEIFENIEESCESILADSTEIHQIIINLVTNSYHAIKERGEGRIEINLDEVGIDVQKSYRMINLPSGRYVRLSVKDTGCGIPEDRIQKIFEPYYSTKKQGEGTGLGLSIIYNIVKSYSGEIEVESDPESGTVFSVYFPVVQDLDNAVPDLRGIPAEQRGSGNILVVDDDKTLAEMNKKILESLGYSVSKFTSSLKALQFFLRDPSRIDLILTDMTMPDMTGSRLAKEILAVREEIPIIICTGFSDMINSEEAYKLGVSSFLMKPVSITKLAECVDKALNDYSKDQNKGD